MTLTLAEPEAVMLPGMFRWSCRKGEVVRGEGVPCAASGTDRAEYERHMRAGHGLKSCGAAKLIKLSKNAPAATLGKPVLPVLGDITWTEHDTGERSGQFWANGPYLRTVWVMPYEAAPWERGRARPVLLRVEQDGSVHVHYRNPADHRDWQKHAELMAHWGVTVAEPSEAESHEDAPAEAVDVYDVQQDEIVSVPRAEAAAGIARYGRSLGEGTPACGEYERRALEVARGDDDDTEPDESATEAGAQTGDAMSIGGAFIHAAERAAAETARAGVRAAVHSAMRQPSAVVSATQNGYGDDLAAKLRETHARNVARREARQQGTRTAELAVREGVVVEYDSDPPEPINGAELLGHLAGYFGNYVAFPSTAAHVTVSLWNAAAAARDRDDSGIGPLIWRALALLGLTSSENKSGKSTVMDLTGYVQGVKRPLKITGRSLAQKLGRKHEAVMLDEAKVTFGAGAASRDVQAVMLGAYSRGGTWDYTSGNADKSIPCFGPVVYAAKDELITATGEQLIDIFDRTIFIRMKRAKTLKPQTDEQAEDDGALLGQSLAEWTSSVKHQLKARARELADLDYQASLAAAETGREVDGRRPQIWRPLLAVADVAEGPWPSLARQAMRELTDGAPALEAASKMDQVSQRAKRWSAPAFLGGAPAAPAEDLDDDYDDVDDL